ncbi:MAG: phospholipid carrier-dependent glycosyltransferase, partial [Terriglobales bacterium]
MNLAVTCAPFRGGTDLQQSLEGFNWLFAQDWRSAVSRARLAVSVFAVGLCLLVWTTARQMFDLATAVVATLLVVFEPNVLAFGGLIMTDVPVTCMMLFAVYVFYLWMRNRTAPFLLLAGLA